MEITIKDHDEKHFRVNFPYDAEAIRDIKMINGRKWDNINKFWIVPKTEYVALDRFREKYFSITSDKDFDTTPRKKDGTFDHNAPNAGDYYDS